MKRLVHAAVWLLLLAFGLNARTISYSLTIRHPEQHVALVEIRVPVRGADTLTFVMPSWSPGRYVLYNFSMNVFDVQAFAKGEPLPRPILADKQTWRVPASGRDEIVLRYRVFANTLDGTFSQINAQGATLNGACLFMYVQGRKSWPVQLTVQYPSAWQLVTPLDKQGKVWLADNYDRLIDSPMELGHLHVYRLQVLNKEHLLVFHQPLPPRVLAVFQKDLRKVIRYQASLFDGDLPYKRYVFFFHLKPDLAHADGMEHLNACRVMLRMDVNKIRCDANTDPDYDNLIWLSAHEFFHTWNIKRLRPRGLGPFDYRHEVFTQTLWIVEGWTSYYAYLSLLRTGIYSQKKWLDEIAGRITRYEGNPGKKYRTLAETSILTWLFKGHVPRFAATNIDTTTYSYYYKGLIVGFLLDILLRSRSKGRYSLDGLLHEMWQTFYKSSKTDYYLPGRGYSEQEVEKRIVYRLGKAGRTFLATTVHSTRPLPYDLLQRLGLRLEWDAQTRRYSLTKIRPANSDAQRLWNDFLKPRVEATHASPLRQRQRQQSQQ